MHAIIKYQNWIHSDVILIILLTSLLCTPVCAGLTVSGGKYMGEIAPGETIVQAITINSAPTDDPVDIWIDIMGFGQSPDRSYVGLPAQEDTGQFSARSFITIDTNAFTLNPGESKRVKATINVPKDVGSGGRYAMIYIHTKPAGTGIVSIASAFGVPVMVTIKGQPFSETGSITDVKEVTQQDGKTAIVTTFKNTGNHHYYAATNVVTVTDASGIQAASITLEPSLTAIIPGALVTFEAVTSTPLQPGMYTVESKITLPNGTVFDSKRLVVEVTSTSAEQTLISPAPQGTLDSASSADHNSGRVNSSSQVVVEKTYSPGPSPLISCGVFAVAFLWISRKK